MSSIQVLSTKSTFRRPLKRSWILQCDNLQKKAWTYDGVDRDEQDEADQPQERSSC